MPNEGCQLREVLSALAELDECVVSLVRVLELVNIPDNRKLLLIAEMRVCHEVALANPRIRVGVSVI